MTTLNAPRAVPAGIRDGASRTIADDLAKLDELQRRFAPPATSGDPLSPRDRELFEGSVKQSREFMREASSSLSRGDGCHDLLTACNRTIVAQSNLAGRCESNCDANGPVPLIELARVVRGMVAALAAFRDKLVIEIERDA